MEDATVRDWWADRGWDGMGGMGGVQLGVEEYHTSIVLVEEEDKHTATYSKL